nr:RecName: Full=Small cysteine-rich protein; Short=Avir_SCRiP; Short=SCRiP; Flags: Precursor [Anemonia viridis]
FVCVQARQIDPEQILRTPEKRASCSSRGGICRSTSIGCPRRYHSCHLFHHCRSHGDSCCCPNYG